MNLEKYKNNGWGLNKLQLEQLLEIITKFKNDKIRVLEFGSGKSTEFMVDIVLNKIKSLDITSFDDNENYAYKGKHDFLDLKIRNLVECNDEDYNHMFKTKKLDNSLLQPKKTPLSTRQRNNFYEILDGDLVGIYDLMILDGPNGNGRNISYLHTKKHLGVGSIVLIDDYTHYDFIEKFNIFFDYDIIHKNETTEGSWCFLKIKKLKK